MNKKWLFVINIANNENANDFTWFWLHQLIKGERLKGKYLDITKKRTVKSLTRKL